jgi:aspartyl-tRNA(Asn)/glutamyl-tRNA(Gln) amidotransferase subunit C
MSLTVEEVKKIAKLARIKLSDQEVAKYQSEISGILSWINQLDEVKTEGVEPMTTAEDKPLGMREDKVGVFPDGATQQTILSNAPNSKYNYFVVSKVVE